MWRVVVVGVLWANGAVAGPTVPRADLEIVPAEWRSAWDPLQKSVEEARAEEAQRQGDLNDADRAWRAANAAARSAERTLAEREKAVKAARKDPASAAGAATARAQAHQVWQDADRQERVARGQLEVATAARDVAASRRELAEAMLEQARAQLVADAGGWADIARFDEAAADARRDVLDAEARLAEARARAALWAQGGGGG